MSVFEYGLAGHCLAVVMVLGICAGCGEKKVPHVRAPWTPRMANPAPQTFKDGPAKTLDEMEDDDVMVAVNGIPLYKWQFTEELDRFWWSIKQNQRAKSQELEYAYRQFGRSYIGDYINSQLLLQAARSQGAALLAPSQIVERVEQGVRLAARQFSMPPKILDRNIPGGLNALRYTLEDHLWKNAYIASNVVVRPVEASLISNIYAQVETENAGIEVTNKMQRAKIEKVYARVKAGEDFGKLVDEFGEDSSVEKGKDGYWDSYQTVMDVPEDIRKNVFDLPVGGITPILQDDEGYYFIKLLKKTDIPQPTNMAAVVEYDMGRMFVATEQYVTLPTGYDLKKSIAEQFRTEAIHDRLTNLLAQAQIVYPNGSNFFGRVGAKAQNAKGKAKGKRKRPGEAERKALKIKKVIEQGGDPKKVFKIEKQGAKKAVKDSAVKPKHKGKKAKQVQKDVKAKQEVGK